MNGAEQPNSPHECILYIEHEPALVKLAEKILQRMGYEVVICSSSFDAIKLFQADPYRFNLIIVDIVMPDMSGFELSQILLELRPDIPLIIRTYQGEMIIEKNSKGVGLNEFLKNPILLHDLEMAVNKVLKDKVKEKLYSSMKPRMALKNLLI